MANLFDIQKITVGKDKLCARVAVNPDMPLMTSEDIEATARVYYLAPGIAKHLCLGDTGSEFQDCMGDTEMAHLLEHVSVEIMNQTGLAGKVSCGRTRAAADQDRAYDIELSCPDDVLTIGALSSASFMMDWAFLAADTPAPDFEGTVDALKQLVLSLRPAEDTPAESADEDTPAEGENIDTADDAAVAAADDAADEPASEKDAAAVEPEPEPEPAPEPVSEPEPESEPAPEPVAADAPSTAPNPLVSPATYFDEQ